MDFLIHPCRWIDDEENVRTPPKLGRYWEMHPLRPLSGLGKSLGRRGWISQYLPRFGGARIQCSMNMICEEVKSLFCPEALIVRLLLHSFPHSKHKCLPDIRSSGFGEAPHNTEPFSILPKGAQYSLVVVLSSCIWKHLNFSAKQLRAATGCIWIQ